MTSFIQQKNIKSADLRSTLNLVSKERIEIAFGGGTMKKWVLFIFTLGFIMTFQMNVFADVGQKEPHKSRNHHIGETTTSTDDHSESTDQIDFQCIIFIFQSDTKPSSSCE